MVLLLNISILLHDLLVLNLNTMRSFEGGDCVPVAGADVLLNHTRMFVAVGINLSQISIQQHRQQKQLFIYKNKIQKMSIQKYTEDSPLKCLDRHLR